MDLNAPEYVRQLRRIGPRPTEPLVRNIMRSGDAAYAPLIALATNIELLHEDEPECFGPVHALRLLGELPRVAMIEPLLRQFPIELLSEEDQLTRLWGNEAPQIIGRLGAEAVEPLWSIIDTPEWAEQARGTAVIALCCAATIAPEQRDNVVAGMRQRLEQTADTILSSYLAVGLANLGVKEAYSEIMAFYRAGEVKQEIMPPKVARQLLLSGGEQGLNCTKHPLTERYDQHGPAERRSA